LIKSEKDQQRLSNSFFFCRRRSIPFSITQSSWNFNDLMNLIDQYRSLLPIEGRQQRPWFDAPVGILLMHRSLWESSKGYNEKLIYWGFMDAELGQRVGLKYPLVNLEKEFSCDFYHMRHSSFSLKKTNRKKNERVIPQKLTTNDDKWGLIDYSFEINKGVPQFQQEFGSHILPINKSLLFYQIFRENFWEITLTVLRSILNLIRLTPYELENKYNTQNKTN